MLKTVSWLAGYLEGEGSFMAPPPSAPTRHRIVAKSIDYDVIKHLADIFGMAIYAHPPDKPHWNDTYEITLGYGKARDWMARFYPYMGERRQGQIRQALGTELECEPVELNTFEWMLGFLEGEGSFMAPPPSEPNRVRVQVQSTDLDVLERVGEYFNVKVTGPYLTKNANAKPYYMVFKRGKAAADFMKLARPHLSERRQGQIDAALDGFVYRDGFGETNSQSKLTEENVRYIKRELRKKEKTQISLAREFDVDPKVITFIKQGKTWAHVLID